MRTEAQEAINRELVEAALVTISAAETICKRTKYMLSQAVRPEVKNKVTAYDIYQTEFAALATLSPLINAFEVVMAIGTVIESQTTYNERVRLNRVHFTGETGATHRISLNYRSLSL